MPNKLQQLKDELSTADIIKAIRRKAYDNSLKEYNKAMAEVKKLVDEINKIESMTIQPGILNTHTKEILDHQTYRKREDLRALLGCDQYKLTIKEINKKHYELIESKWH